VVAAAEAEHVVATFGGGSEGAKQLDRTQHQEEQGKDHAPGDRALSGEHAGGLRGGHDRQDGDGDDNREALHGSATAKRDRMGVPSVSTMSGYMPVHHGTLAQISCAAKTKASLIDMRMVDIVTLGAASSAPSRAFSDHAPKISKEPDVRITHPALRLVTARQTSWSIRASPGR
jgi:hypothetical protein